MDFPSRLKQLRAEFKLTQEQLGKKINVTKVSVSGYESGNRKPDIDTLQRLSDFFQVNVDYLLGKTDIRTVRTEISDEANLFLEVVELTDDEEAIRRLKGSFVYRGEELSDDAAKKILSHARFVLFEERSKHSPDK